MPPRNLDRSPAPTALSGLTPALQPPHRDWLAGHKAILTSLEKRMLTPGTTNLITTVLGPVLGQDTDPYALRRRHAEHSAEGQLAELVLLAARRLSDIEQNLRQKVGSAADILSRVTATLDAGQAGNPHGELQTTGQDVDLLAARLADAHQWLIHTLRAYRDAVAQQ